MSATKPNYLEVLSRAPAGFVRADELKAAQLAVQELVELTRDLSRGMPQRYADNASVIGASNALVLEKIRGALAAKFGGA